MNEINLPENFKELSLEFCWRTDFHKEAELLKEQLDISIKNYGSLKNVTWGQNVIEILIYMCV